MYPLNLPDLNNPPLESILGTKYLNADYLFDQLLKFFTFISHKETLTNLNNLLILLTLFFLTIIFYCAVRLFEIRRKEHHHLEQEIREYAHRQAEREKKEQAERMVSENERWRKVLDYLFSANGADWKLAVIEADAMLEALLDQLGFKGETFSDKLKTADPEKFHSLPAAWEVHAIRNRIAHEGSEFSLSQHEAKRVVALYESIFRQYGYI